MKRRHYQLSRRGYSLPELVKQRAKREWWDDNPFYLMIVLPDEARAVEVDVAEPNWTKIYAAFLRGRSQWCLVRKVDMGVVFMVDVFDGEQPYYSTHHNGVVPVNGGPVKEILSYGIGKKLADGTTMRLWVMPTGVVCGGNDIDSLGNELVRSLT